MELEHDNIMVVAGSNLQRGTTYGPLKGFEFSSFWVTDTLPTENVRLIQIFFQNGMMVSNNKQFPWTHYLRTSRDIYEQNIEAVRSNDGNVFIRTTRNVIKGELLCGWYEEGYAREINVPYLTLQNIRGIQDYRCHLCGRRTKFPNILKAHMMYDCPNSSRDFDLVYCFDSLKSQSRENPCPREHCEKQKNSFELSKPKYIADFSILAKANKAGGVTKSLDLDYQYLTSINCQFSFEINKHPFKDNCRFDTDLALVPRGDLIQKHSKITSTKENRPMKSQHLNHCVKDPMTRFSSSDEEPLELLHKSFIEFSTKRGHLCVYCGKFYSRKYGLKIHLRTHTGYKPLKCKICQRAFGDPSNLNKHIRLHAEGSTPYRCHHCGKVLVRRRDLARHLKSRHPDEKV